MNRKPLPIGVIVILQLLAVILYPPDFFQKAPQAIVLPAALLLFLAIALFAMNIGLFSPLNGKNSLVFVQGLNLVVRLMLLFPNLKHADGSVDMLLLALQLVGMGLSWYTMLEIDRLPVGQLLFDFGGKSESLG